MIAYHKIWLYNLLVQEQVEKEYRTGNLTDAELKNVMEKYPVGFYTPNVFIRVGLFLLTCVIISFAYGLVTLILIDTKLIVKPGYFLFLGVTVYIALEFVIKNMNHFRSGVDDALIWISSGLILSAFYLYTDAQDMRQQDLAIAGFMVVLGCYFSLRFADVLMTAATFLSFIAFIFILWNQIPGWGLITMPFLMMAITAGSYLLCRFGRHKAITVHYSNCLIALQVLSLLVLYLAGNYFIVQTLGSDIASDKTPQVPFAPFFWTWTIVLPFIYIGAGIKKKDVTLLRTGLLLVAAAAFTFRNYYHLMPIEATLALIGATLLLAAYGIMKYLKTPKHGFTYEIVDEENIMDKLKIESLIVSETFSGTPAAAEGTRFGDGNFGGGGTSSNF
ncbi:hypothetical protein [Pedobacter frigoris]|uniref:DUF2157 domain-containing protein n=1 Tax=Pedobacter frigoris TaxID=2571272 RepID=A0A4U1CJ41_9SPHI|nr:hypothetical protein [Pedobacter frigoris]TKC04896.1 hypothetical protein FA047_14080 [Pedobacter frigoris]